MFLGSSLGLYVCSSHKHDPPCVDKVVFNLGEDVFFQIQVADRVYGIDICIWADLNRFC